VSASATQCGQRWRATLTTVVAALAMVAGTVSADDARTAFRPCIDPSNLPFANDKGEGFENRIAELFAKQLGVPVQSYSFPQRMNFIRNTLRYKLPGEDFRCDIVMSVPATYDQALPTAPYYHSTYALVYRKGQGLDSVKSGADLFALPQNVRDKLRIGIYDRSPASIWLVRHGMEAQVKPFPMMSPNPEQYPGEIIEKDLAQGNIDAAVVWGPIAGFYAKRVRNVELTVIPLKSEPGVKFDYEIAMGVRQGEREWKATVDKLLVDNQAAIASILREYNVPLVDAQGDPVN
jgi:mxaJ protein